MKFLPGIESFRFESPWLLLLLLLIPLWAWLRGKVGRTAAVPLASTSILKRSVKPRFQFGVLIGLMRFAALTLLIVAVARPQVEKGLGERDAKGINMVLALDYSGTMNKRDFRLEGRQVSRIDALKKVMGEFIRTRPNDKFGLVRFDAEAVLLSPLTLDHDWLLAQISGEQPGRGTAPGSALLVAADALKAATNETRVIILATDAENMNRGPDPEDVARVIGKLGIRVHVIHLIDFSEMSFESGISDKIRETCRLTGGQMFRVPDYTSLRNVYTQIDRLEKKAFSDGRQKSFRELMAWFAAAGLGLLLLEVLLAQLVWRRLP